ncbi:Sensor protein kinase WalK [compost metagenome]
MDFRVSGEIVLVDRDSFKRVLGNVIQNSIKYMDKEEKKISLYAVTDGRKMDMVIEDNGRGIEAEAVPHIFERFYRAEQSRNSETGGNGLGLAIAKQIVLTHGGEIRAESIEGKGTRILISLPVVQKGGEGHE